MSTRTLLPFAAALLLVPAIAQNSLAPAPTAQVAGAEQTAGTATRDKDTLSVDFPDEDIKTILRNVADLFELNLVVPDTLVGKTTIKLRDVTWRQIFQVVLSPAGYSFVEEGNIIKIVSAESLATEPVSTEVFILNNAKAQDIKPTVDGLVDPAAGGKILVDGRSNALVVTERPSRMTRIRVIVEQLDKATAQVMIESKFVEVSDSDIRNIGVNWASLQGWRLGASRMTQEFSRERGQNYSNNVSTSNGTSASGSTTNSSSQTNTTGTSTSNGTTAGTNTGTTNSSNNSSSLNNTSTYVATPDGVNGSSNAFGSGSFNPATGTLTGISPNPAQATLGAASYTPATINPTTGAVTPASFTSPYTFNGSVTSTAASGTSGSTSNGTTSSTNTSNSTSLSDTIADTATNAVSNAVNNLIGLTNTGGTERLTSAVFSAGDFNVILSALKQQNNTKVVSNPTIVTLNNTEATINVGSEFPIPSYTYNSERGTFEVSGFQYKPIGVILKVTPQVNAQGTIRLALEPEISSSNRETSFGGAGGATIPIIDTRKVKTQVSLKDGYTAGIGGLLSASKAHGGTKVPVLGSIPVLGRLFSSKSVNDVTTNLLIFITAKSVNPDGAAPEDIFSASSLQAAGEEAKGGEKK